MIKNTSMELVSLIGMPFVDFYKQISNKNLKDWYAVYILTREIL